MIPIALPRSVLGDRAPFGRLHVSLIGTFVGPLGCLGVRFVVPGSSARRIRIANFRRFERRFLIRYSAHILLVQHDINRVLDHLRLSFLHKVHSMEIELVLHFERLQFLAISYLIVFLLFQVELVRYDFSLHIHHLVVDIEHF